MLMRCKQAENDEREPRAVLFPDLYFRRMTSCAGKNPENFEVFKSFPYRSRQKVDRKHAITL
jgi:hypothetical protein